jgi:hypothetical protein
LQTLAPGPARRRKSTRSAAPFGQHGTGQASQVASLWASPTKVACCFSHCPHRACRAALPHFSHTPRTPRRLIRPPGRFAAQSFGSQGQGAPLRGCLPREPRNPWAAQVFPGNLEGDKRAKSPLENRPGATDGGPGRPHQQHIHPSGHNRWPASMRHPCLVPV